MKKATKIRHIFTVIALYHRPKGRSFTARNGKTKDIFKIKNNANAIKI